MNFNSVDAVVGQQDTKGYQVKVALNGTVGQAYPSEFNKKGKKTQNVMVTDTQGIEQKVKIYLGNNPDIMAGSTGTFLVGPNPYENIMYYNGFIQGQLQGGAAPQQQPQQQAPQQPQTGFLPKPQQQAPPQNDVQDNIRFAQALNLASAEYVGCKIEESSIKERARIYYHILKSRQFPVSMSNDTPPPQQDAPQQPAQQQQPPNPEFNPNAAFNPTDDIPF